MEHRLRSFREPSFSACERLRGAWVPVGAKQGATASSRNTAVGYQALRTVAQGTAGANQENTAIGYQAGDVATTGAYNVNVAAGLIFMQASAAVTLTAGGAMLLTAPAGVITILGVSIYLN